MLTLVPSLRANKFFFLALYWKWFVYKVVESTEVKSKHMVIGTGCTAGVFSPIICKCSTLIVSIQFPNHTCEEHIVNLNNLADSFQFDFQFFL